jgi:hypothetical protein
MTILAEQSVNWELSALCFCAAPIWPGVIKVRLGLITKPEWIRCPYLSPALRHCFIKHLASFPPKFDALRCTSVLSVGLLYLGQYAKVDTQTVCVLCVSHCKTNSLTALIVSLD